MTTVVTPKEGHVFVVTYGSLRLGQANFRVNARGNGVHVGTGKTAENFNLYRYGGSYFPSVSLKHNSNGTPVVVDVFEAPLEGLLGAYDSLEGCYAPNDESNFYNRTEIKVELDDGSVLTGWIYHIDEEQSELVESGDWSKYLAGE